MSVAHFIPVEVLNVARRAMCIEVFAAVWIIPVPAIVAVKVVVHVTPEMIVAMEPGSGTDKDAAGKPFRPIVAIGRAIIRRIVGGAVGGLWVRPHLARHLCVCFLWRSRKTESSNSD